MINGTIAGGQVLKGEMTPRGNDGISPTVEVKENENGHVVEITDVKGKKSFEVKDGYTPVKGVDYADGVSVTHEWNGTTLKVKSASGESSADLKGDKGDPFKYSDFTSAQLAALKGEKGDPGYTPQKNVDYFDGEKGDPGYTPVKGKDYFDGKDGTSATHSWDGTTLTINSASGSSSADLKGDKGDKGDSAPAPFYSSQIHTNPVIGGVYSIEYNDINLDGRVLEVGSVVIFADGSLWYIQNPTVSSDGSVIAVCYASLKGPKGDRGDPGYTPVKGVDYFDGKDYVLTESDKAEIADQASKLIDIPEADGSGVVCVTYDYQTGKCSHNRAQIQELAASGKIVVFKENAFPEYTYYLQDSGGALFARLDPEEEYFKAYYAAVNSDGTAKLWNQNLAQDTVRFYASQVLSEEFKARARNNIGAAADDDVVKTVNGAAPDNNGNVEIAGGGSGIEVTAKPGQLIRVKEVDENGNPTAWEAVPWGYTGKGWLLEETDATEDADPNFGKIWVITKAPMLTVGDLCTVIYNGVPYDCVCSPVNIPGMSLPADAVAVGNFAAVGGEDTGEPFAMMIVPSYQMTMNLDLTGATSVRVGIMGGEIHHPIPCELLPEGVPYAVDLGVMEILPETELVTDDGMAMLENAISGVTNGEKYTVKYNGIEYETTAVEQTVEGGTAICLGNIGVLMGNAGTDEPFAMAIMPDFALIVSLDGATELTISIKGKAAIIQKLDKRCLPNDSGFAKLFTVNVSGKIDALTADKTFSEIASAVKDGNTIVRMLVEISTYTRDVLHLARYTNSAVYFSSEYAVDDSGTRKFHSVRIDDDNSVHDYRTY